jgi:hypothetical protein
MYKRTQLQQFIGNLVTNGLNYAALTFTGHNVKDRPNASINPLNPPPTHTHTLTCDMYTVTWTVDMQLSLRQIPQQIHVSVARVSENVKKKIIQL